MNAQPKLANRVVMTMTRTIHVPCDVVFRAWTLRDRFAQWWGPKGFTAPVCDIDVRPGGKMRIHMRAPDGSIYPMTGTFHEVLAPHRLVFSAEAVDPDGAMQISEVVVVSLEPIGSETRLTVHADAVGVAPVAPQMLAGMETGWAQSLDRLADVVED